jgi:hypothetical protein
MGSKGHKCHCCFTFCVGEATLDGAEGVCALGKLTRGCSFVVLTHKTT